MIVYLHGFNSSPQSFKARLLGEEMRRRGLADRYACPTLPHLAEAALAAATAAIIPRLPGPVTLVGSSLGGFYASFLAETLDLRAVLINPAVAPHRLLRGLDAEQVNHYTGERYRLTEEHLQQWQALDHFTVTPARYLLLQTRGDEVLDYRDAVKKYRGCEQRLIDGGDHSFAMFGEHLQRILAYAGIAGAARV